MVHAFRAGSRRELGARRGTGASRRLGVGGLQSLRRLPREEYCTVGKLGIGASKILAFSLSNSQTITAIIDTYQQIVFCLISTSWNKPLSIGQHLFSLAARHKMPRTVLMAVERKNPIEARRRRSLGQLCEYCLSSRAAV